MRYIRIFRMLRLSHNFIDYLYLFLIVRIIIICEKVPKRTLLLSPSFALPASDFTKLRRSFYRSSQTYALRFRQTKPFSDVSWPISVSARHSQPSSAHFSATVNVCFLRLYTFSATRTYLAFSSSSVLSELTALLLHPYSASCNRTAIWMPRDKSQPRRRIRSSFVREIYSYVNFYFRLLFYSDFSFERLRHRTKRSE